MKCKKILLGSLIIAGALGASSIAFASVSSIHVGYNSVDGYNTFGLSCTKASFTVGAGSSQTQSNSGLAQQFGNQNCKLTLRGLNSSGHPTTVTLATLHTTINNGLLGYTNFTETSRTGKSGTGIYYGSKELLVKSLGHSQGNGSISFMLTDSSSPFAAN